MKKGRHHEERDLGLLLDGPERVTGVAAQPRGNPARREDAGADGDQRRQQRHEKALAQQQEESQHGAERDRQPDVIIGGLASLRAETVTMDRRIGQQRVSQHGP